MKKTSQNTIEIRSDLMKKRIQRAEWISFIMMCVTFLSLFFNLLMASFSLQMLPYLTVVALPVTQTMNTKEAVDIEPLDDEISSIDIIHEALIRFYVERYHSVFPDADEMNRRWMFGGEVNALSSPAVYEKFYNQRKDRVEALIAQINGVVDIDIKKVSHIGANWQIEFDQRTFKADGKVDVKSYIAAARIQDVPERVYYGRFFINPVGMVVTDYSYSQKKN